MNLLSKIPWPLLRHWQSVCSIIISVIFTLFLLFFFVCFFFNCRPYIIDLESANGTFLNNQKIEPRRFYELKEKVTALFTRGRRNKLQTSFHKWRDVSRVSKLRASFFSLKYWARIVMFLSPLSTSRAYVCNTPFISKRAR